MAVFHESEEPLQERIGMYLEKTTGIGGFEEHVFVLRSTDCSQVLVIFLRAHAPKSNA